MACSQSPQWPDWPPGCRRRLAGWVGQDPALGEYELAISRLAGARDPHKKDLKVYSFQPAAFVRELDNIIEALATVVEQAGNIGD
jgi:hypothetical protein